MMSEECCGKKRLHGNKVLPRQILLPAVIVSRFTIFLSMYCRLTTRYAIYNMLNQVKMDDNAEGRLSFKVNWIILEVHNVNPMEQ